MSWKVKSAWKGGEELKKELDLFFVYCWTETGEFIFAGMTDDWVALSLFKSGFSYPIWLPVGWKNLTPKNIIVPLEIFKHVTKRYGISELNPPLCDKCLKTNVPSKVLLNDGRQATVGITLATCWELLERGSQGRVRVEYKTKEELGDDVHFVGIFVDHLVVQILEGKKKFCYHTKQKRFRAIKFN